MTTLMKEMRIAIYKDNLVYFFFCFLLNQFLNVSDNFGYVKLTIIRVKFDPLGTTKVNVLYKRLEYLRVRL